MDLVLCNYIYVTYIACLTQKERVALNGFIEILVSYEVLCALFALNGLAFMAL